MEMENVIVGTCVFHFSGEAQRVLVCVVVSGSV